MTRVVKAERTGLATAARGGFANTGVLIVIGGPVSHRALAALVLTATLGVGMASSARPHDVSATHSASPGLAADASSSVLSPPSGVPVASPGAPSVVAGDRSTGPVSWLRITDPREGQAVDVDEAPRIPALPAPGQVFKVMVRVHPVAAEESEWHIVGCRPDDDTPGHTICPGVRFGNPGDFGPWDLVAILVTEARARELVSVPGKVYRGRVESMGVIARSKVYLHRR
jgi:hypothetical protein